MSKNITTKLNFSKMHGAGNDFVVIDAISQKLSNSTLKRKQLCQKIADRHLGVGCDQVLFVEKSKTSSQDFFYSVFNADGSISENCGNGARCFALFVRNHKLSNKKKLVLGIVGGQLIVEQLNKSLKTKNIYRVELPPPIFTPSKIPYLPTGYLNKTLGTSIIQVKKRFYEISVLSIGNPHAVLLVKNVETAKVVEIGSQIESHPAFPKRVNVSFMEIINSQKIRLRVFERGSGETLACGTGACASVVAGIRKGLLASNKPIEVLFLGGRLKISWSAKNKSPIYMEGEATEVFRAQIKI